MKRSKFSYTQIMYVSKRVETGICLLDVFCKWTAAQRCFTDAWPYIATMHSEFFTHGKFHAFGDDRRKNQTLFIFKTAPALHLLQSAADGHP